MRKIRVLVSVYAGVTNKGTEALLRGLGEILCDKFENKIELSISSIQPNIDKKKHLPFYKNYYLRELSAVPKIGQIFRLLFIVLKLLGLSDLVFMMKYSPLFKAVKKQDVFIEMGADNYDVEYGKSYLNLYKIHDWIQKHYKIKMLLYNCSLNEESVTMDFIKEIERFSLITIRESESLNNLIKLYKGDKAYYCPDPAFIMKPEKIMLPAVLLERDCVGVNLSNLIIGKSYGVKAQENALGNYYYLIDSILTETNMGIVLIPHVMKNADLSILRKLYEKYVNNNRVFLIENENLSATELKYIISNFRFLVTARTHASIAAYSTFVPTLVLGYSVKSKGIARDLFDDIENYVVSIRDLQNEADLWNRFNWIMENEEGIKNRLKYIIPYYIDKSKCIGNLVEKIINDKI